ncbi:MAG: CHAP domain-containing protein, partial [Candidatus Dormibacteraceae bacterium]
TQDAGLDDAAQQAHLVAAQLDRSRQRDRSSERALTTKQKQVKVIQQQLQGSLAQLELLASQLETQQLQLQTQLGATDTALDAALTAGLYTPSTSDLHWPATPDPAPLGLSAYPGYCAYTPIQCTCYAANAYQAFTGGVLPQDLGNGGQWIAGARKAGIPTSQTPTEGAVVSFDGPGYSVDGHVAIVRSVIYSSGKPVGLVVWERNFDDAGGFDVRYVPLGAESGIAGYIPPGA